MSEIPMDAKILMNEFLAQQREQEVIRAKEKRERLSKSEFDNVARKPLRAKEVERYAKNFGFSIEDGKGRHGVHLVAPNGQECPLPVHGRGRTLATGTQHSIVSFIHQNGIK